MFLSYFKNFIKLLKPNQFVYKINIDQPCYFSANIDKLFSAACYYSVEKSKIYRIAYFPWTVLSE